MSHIPTLEYFESDQIRLAVSLWKLVRRAKETDFDVLRFGREWVYADDVLLLCMRSEDEAVSQATIELMQLRACLEQQKPELARKLGAKSATAPRAEPDVAMQGVRGGMPEQRQRDNPTIGHDASAKKPSLPASDREAPATPAQPRYTKSLR